MNLRSLLLVLSITITILFTYKLITVDYPTTTNRNNVKRLGITSARTQRRANQPPPPPIITKQLENQDQIDATQLTEKYKTIVSLPKDPLPKDPSPPKPLPPPPPYFKPIVSPVPSISPVPPTIKSLPVISKTSSPPPPNMPPPKMATTSTTKSSKKSQQKPIQRDQFQYTLARPIETSAGHTVSNNNNVEWKKPKICPHKTVKPQSSFETNIINTESTTKANAVIIYTVHVKTWQKFVSSLRLLELHFLKCYSYPIHIFAEDSAEGKISDSQLATLGEIAPSAESITIQRLCFDDCVPTVGFPQVDFTVNDAKGWLKQLGFGWLGYSNMCRFYSYTFALVPELLKYDYYMRLDSDSYLCEPVKGDIFLKFHQKKCQYGYSALTQDSEKVTVGLYPSVLKWIGQNQKAIDTNLINPKRLKYFAEDWIYKGDVGQRHEVWEKNQVRSGKYSNRMFETNFEISSFKPWRTKQWRSLMHQLETDKMNGFYKKRWGDAPIHAIGIPLLLDDSEVCYIPFDWFGQRHKWMDPKPTVRKAESWSKSRPQCSELTHDINRNIHVPIEHRYRDHNIVQPVQPNQVTNGNSNSNNNNTSPNSIPKSIPKSIPAKTVPPTVPTTVPVSSKMQDIDLNPTPPNKVIPNLASSTASSASSASSTSSSTVSNSKHSIKNFDQLSFLSKSKSVLHLPQSVHDGSVEKYLNKEIPTCHGKRVLVYHGNLQRDLNGASKGNSMGETVYFFSILKALHNICGSEDGKTQGSFVYASSEDELKSLPEVRMLQQPVRQQANRQQQQHQQHRRVGSRRLLVTNTSSLNTTTISTATTPTNTATTTVTPTPPTPPPSRFNFDLIITDTESLKSLQRLGLNQENCKYRVLDVWGTPPSQNHLKLHTKQYWTPFPFTHRNAPVDDSPNTVVGNRVEGPGSSMNLPHTLCENKNVKTTDPKKEQKKQKEQKEQKKQKPVIKKRQIAIWGKEQKYFTPQVLDVLRKISDRFNIPMYVAGKDAVTCTLPNGIYNLGILPMDQRTQLLAESMFFIGLGHPVLGASPFEAMAHGTIYLNRMYHQPINLWQNKQFTYTSQHPYAGYVGAPLAYDVEWQNSNSNHYIIKVLEKLLNDVNTKGTGATSLPFVPISFRPEYIESIVLENMFRDYCSMSKGERSRGVARNPISEYPSKYEKKPWQNLKDGCRTTSSESSGKSSESSGKSSESSGSNEGNGSNGSGSKIVAGHDALLNKKPSPVTFNITSCKELNFAILVDKDLRGSDLYSFPSKRVENCCERCKQESQCHSFTWAKDTCWLKKITSEMLAAQGSRISLFVSGVVSGTELKVLTEH